MNKNNVISFLFGILLNASAINACPGCPFEEDVTNPSVLESLKTTLSNLKTMPTGTENEQITLVKVNKLTSQVINGMLHTYEIEAQGVKTQKRYECNIVIWSRPWLGADRIEKYECKPSVSRSKRSPFGRMIQVDVEHDQRLPELKTVIEEEMNKQLKPQKVMSILKFIEATQQVVSGLLIKAKVEVAESDCPAGATSPQLCTFKEKGHQVCSIQVWEKRWLNMKKVSIEECSEIQSNDCLECLEDLDPNDDGVKYTLKRAISKFNSESSGKKWTIINITKAQALGLRTKYVFEFQAEDEGKSKFTCNAEVFKMPWITDEPLKVDVKCLPVKNQ